MATSINITKKYPKYYFFNKERFLGLIKSLETEGFEDFEIKIPTNFKESKEKINVERFISFEYNFKAIILVASSKSSGELIKILFVNVTSSKKRFDDFTFPSTESEGPQYYISTHSKVRLYGLEKWIKEVLKEYNLNKGGEYILVEFFSILSFFYIFGFVLYYLRQREIDGFNIAYQYKILLWVLLVISIIIPYFYLISTKRGLYIKEFENLSLSFINRALKGDFKENPIIYLITRMFITVIIAVLGWVIIGALETFFK